MKRLMACLLLMACGVTQAQQQPSARDVGMAKESAAGGFRAPVPDTLKEAIQDAVSPEALRPRPKPPTVAQPALPKALTPVFAKTAPSADVSLADRSGHEPGQVIVALPLEGTALSLPTLARQVGGVLRSQVRLAGLGMQVGVLQMADEARARDAVQQLGREHPELVLDLHARAYAQQHGEAVPASPATARHYARSLVGAEALSGTVGTRVGVVDTGLQRDAAEHLLQVGGLHEQRFISPLDRPASPEHGTAVAAILAGRLIEHGPGRGFQGLAPGVVLYQAAVMRDEQGQATSNTLALVLALSWLSEQQVAVVNLSLATRGDRVLAWVVDRLVRGGMVLVAAVGPGSTVPDLVYPAAYPGVIAVAAVDAARQPELRGARGPYVALGAPGIDLWLPVSKGMGAGPGQGGAYYSGSSFAAPWVSAMVARLKAQAGGATWARADLMSRLCAMAQPWPERAVPTGVGCGILAWAPARLAP